jgi:putative endonuclease
MDRQAKGRDAEDRAARFLAERGLTILARNFRRRAGEIDIVALDGATLAIIEVRARASRDYGGAAASVGARKQQRLIRAAHLLLAAHPEWRKLPARFDVIVEEGEGADARIEWIRHAFTL